MASPQDKTANVEQEESSNVTADEAVGTRDSTIGLTHDQPPLEESDADNAISAGVGFHVVGIGASAGGLEALETFFDHLPTDSGMAFVVVQHLSPDFKSVMDELLARHTAIPIHRVTDGIKVAPNAVYLIPPKKEMIVANGKLLLSDKDPGQGLNLLIDIFFRSLAQDVGPRAIGIVLSGTGSDGSRGICDIHEAGGLVLAQDPESSKFDGMPRSAVETGIVDLTLPPDRMSAALLSYVQHPSAVGMEDHIPSDPALLEGFDAIFQLLRKHYDIDFSYYKRGTVTRRVQRRLTMNQITDLDDYVERLRSDSTELNALYKDLLIGVTKFFRDTAAFAQLEAVVLPDLISKLKDQDELRIWVAGCATGEEPYSLAILIHELLEKENRKISVKIFATDVHPTSLSTASVGIYSEASLSEVSPARLQRYFTRVNAGYQVAQDLRQMIVFAPHNIIKDAPFTKIDLITCRNLLIYLEPLAQKKAISLFHFALNTGGVMMMGPSESPGELADEFESIDDRWKIYRKRRDRRLPAEMRLPLSAGYSGPRAPRLIPQEATAIPWSMACDELLKQYAPPTLLINERRELIQSLSGAARFMKLRDGRPSTDVLDLVLPDLRIPLMTGIQQAHKKQSTVVFKGVRVRCDDEERQVKLTIRPIQERNQEKPHFLISLESLANLTPAAAQRSQEDIDLGEASREQLHTMEMELRYTQENLQATVEEMETSNEELQATNEELVASNEELQSTNEELHSVNEELYTVNAEYQKKIAELTELTADMDNLLHSTEVGVVFLDKDLCIRKFTPQIAETFHLLPLDIGRRIDNFTHNIRRLDLLDEFKQVLVDEQVRETEVHDTKGQVFLLRILPYRTKTSMDGIVLTLINITRLKEAEKKLRLMSKVFDDAVDPILIEDLDGRIIDLNAEAERALGWDRESLLNQNINVLFPPDQRFFAKELRARCRESGGLRNVETVVCRKEGDPIPVLQTYSLLTDQDGNPMAIATIAKDISDRKAAERATQEAVKKRDHFLAMLSHELRNPLGAVQNATYLLENTLTEDLPPTFAKACGVIKRQTLQVSRLLDDLLDVARVTQGKIEFRMKVIDLVELVDDAVQAVQPLIDGRRHRLTLEISDQPVYVEADPARLRQVQENLLANAAKYTPEEGDIRLSIKREGNHAVIRVRDNGQGIPEDIRESIFELFMQSDDTLVRENGGMGLGLTLVRNLVELHHGEVTAYSDGPGKGSEFVVRLPTAKAPQENEDPVLSASPKQSKTRRILLVEDNEDSRTMLESLLTMDGYVVSTAATSDEGLRKILEERPDVALVDIGLPEVSGYEIAQRARQRVSKSEVKLIALTGYGRAEDRQKALAAGFDEHLVKPLHPDDLMRAIE